MLKFLKAMTDSLKEFGAQGHHNEELLRFFMNEYKHDGKEAYQYWMNTKSENLYYM